jgi:hypothetical protein
MRRVSIGGKLTGLVFARPRCDEALPVGTAMNPTDWLLQALLTSTHAPPAMTPALLTSFA